MNEAVKGAATETATGTPARAMTGQPVLIIGAGVAGLTLALCLAKRGIASEIFEVAPELSEVGAGLQLAPNAMRILDEIGLTPRLGQTAVTPEALLVRNGITGKEIVRLPLASQMRAGFGASYRVIHRADLQMALLDAARDDPLVSLTLNASIESVEDTGDGVDLTVSVGANRLETRGRALVGADGVRSIVRRRLLGGPPAEYSGYVAWRATLPTEDVPSLVNFDGIRTTSLWLGPHAHFLHYPLRGGRELNIVAIVEDEWEAEGWSLPGLATELMSHFRKWSHNARGLLERPRLWTKWALCAVDPESPWSRGRIVLAGDAAHAMLPFAAQGACSAIEDSAVLARLIAESGTRSVPERLAAYEQARRPRVQRLINASRNNGRTYHLGPPFSNARDLAMRTLGGQRILNRQSWIYGWRDRE